MPALNADLNKATARDQDLHRSVKAVQVDAAAALAEMETIAAAAFTGAVDVSTHASPIQARIPDSINAVRTSGYWRRGDGGDALYRRVSTEPGHAGKFQSADGAWWEIADAALRPQMFGARFVPKGSDDISLARACDITDARNACSDAAQKLGASIDVPSGLYAHG